MDKEAVAGLGPILGLWTWFEANRRTAVMLAGTAAVVALIVAFFIWQQNRKVISAGEALTSILVTSGARGGQPVTSEKLLQLAGEHAGTGAAGRAVFQAAATLFVDGKFAEAQTQFQRFMGENADHPFVPQARYGIAACLEAQGKTDEAAKSYKDISERFKSSGLGLAASCSLGRILESQGKLAEALPLFEEVARADGNGMLGGEARIRVAEIQQKLPPPPAPAPAVVTPTTSLISTNIPAPTGN